MIKYLSSIALIGLLILPIFAQVKEKIQEMQEECRLVRGHAFMIQQMIEENKYNEAVARAHYTIIDTNLKELLFTLREIESLLTAQQKIRVATELDQLYEICNDTKPMVDSLREQLDAEEPNLRRIRILATRINRSLKDAMDINNSMLNKL